MTNRKPQITVRLDEDLFEWLKAQAESERRSLNSMAASLLDQQRCYATGVRRLQRVPASD